MIYAKSRGKLLCYGIVVTNITYLQRVGFASTWFTFTALEQSGAGHHLSKRLHYEENKMIYLYHLYFLWIL